MSKYGYINNLFFALSSCLAFNSNATLVLNEIDYDQPGRDTAEYIELFNSGFSSISLDNYSIDLINGYNGSSYRSIGLSGFSIDAGSYFVVCGDAEQVTNCDYSFTTSNSWFQNGSPDAVGLFESNNLLDSLSYEGTLGIYTEGNVFAFNDSNSLTQSIGRITDGFDSDNNALDFQLNCITPGSSNIAGTGDCSISLSSASASAVPAPATVWLLASGLIGFLGLGRRG